MGSDRIRVSPVSAFCARRAGIAVAVLSLLLLSLSVAPAAGASTQAGLDPGSPTTAPGSTGGTYDTRPIARGASGAVVSMLQKSLRLAGYSVPLTSRFQSGTEKAVRRFQRDRKLPVTGMFDARTAAALRGVLAVPPLPSNTGSDVRSRIVAIARSQLGQGERPAGSNCTKFGPCQEWCADFATWVWRQAGVAGIGRIAWVPDLPLWGKRHGSWKPGDTNNPQPGDLVIFSGLHVGIVERVTSRTITIIAGNTSTNNVARRGPASPANGYAMGPAAISGYVSPVPLVAGARATAAGPLPRPTTAQMAAQDPQTRNPRLAAQEH
jgi:peptidoglycan hydrolase-like protein with peptidoglycan-binding domain